MLQSGIAYASFFAQEWLRVIASTVIGVLIFSLGAEASNTQSQKDNNNNLEPGVHDGRVSILVIYLASHSTISVGSGRAPCMFY
jgi:hypothetical protein